MRGVQASSPGRDAIVNEDRLRDEDAGNVTVPRVFLMTSRASQTRNRLLGAYRGPNMGSAFPVLDSGPEEGRKCDVPGVFLTASSRSGPPGPRSRCLSGRDVHGSRNSCRTSVAPPLPHRPGRLVAATACPGRHETPGTHLGRRSGRRTRTSDGRGRPEGRATRTAATALKPHPRPAAPPPEHPAPPRDQSLRKEEVVLGGGAVGADLEGGRGALCSGGADRVLAGRSWTRRRFRGCSG